MDPSVVSECFPGGQRSHEVLAPVEKYPELQGVQHDVK